MPKNLWCRRLGAGFSYGTCEKSFRSSPRGSLTTFETLSNTIVARLARSYAGQCGSLGVGISRAREGDISLADLLGHPIGVGTFSDQIVRYRDVVEQKRNIQPVTRL